MALYYVRVMKRNTCHMVERYTGSYNPCKIHTHTVYPLVTVTFARDRNYSDNYRKFEHKGGGGSGGGGGGAFRGKQINNLKNDV